MNYCFALLIALLFPALCKAEKDSVVINEVCWMGTEESTYNEWIELKNTTDQTINLLGWKLEAEDGSPDIVLKDSIAPKGFFVLERTDDDSCPSTKADIIYTGGLSNKGENLTLINNRGQIVDAVRNNNGWPEGDNITKQTMERTAVGWQTSANPGGTPGKENSQFPDVSPENKKAKILPTEAYTKPANKRFLTTLFLGLSCSLLSAALTLIIKRNGLGFRK